MRLGAGTAGDLVHWRGDEERSGFAVASTRGVELAGDHLRRFDRHWVGDRYPPRSMAPDLAVVHHSLLPIRSCGGLCDSSEGSEALGSLIIRVSYMMSGTRGGEGYGAPSDHLSDS